MRLSSAHRDWLTLSMVPGVGTTKFIQLLARFRSPANVLNASRAALQAVVGPNLAQRISQYSSAVDVDRQEQRLNEYGGYLITLEDESYPQRLAEIYDPPLVLFVRGQLLESDERAVAVVGTRRATPYGLRMAERFGRKLAARSITVVSGLAEGIDAAAHRGALEAGGRTVAVLGCGVDIVYPRTNADLMHQISEKGAVISQFPMGVKPSAVHFPYRNRIISGMSLGTLVVECPRNSGALITARQAAEQGREVFAVPGPLDHKNSQGPHGLIREGAKLVENVEDILVELDMPVPMQMAVAGHRPGAESIPPSYPSQPAGDPPPVDAPPAERPPVDANFSPQAAVEPVASSPASSQERKVMAVLAPDGSYVDEIADACRFSVSETLSALTLLELKGLVQQFSGKRFAPR